jgi:hypothetical protein
MKHASSILLVSLALACGGESRSADAGIEVDTLPGGAVLVKNGAEGRWALEDREAWTLTEELRIGRVEGDGPDVFGQIRNVIPGAAGTIWILDSQSRELKQFGPDGAFLRTLGGPGGGPGEFGSNPCAFAGQDGEIWVESGNRWQRWTADGELLGAQPVTRSLGCGIRAWRGDELVTGDVEYDPATRERSVFLILHDRSPQGTVTVRDTVPMPTLPDGPTVQWLEGERVRSTGPLPLAHMPRVFLEDSGFLWVSDGGGPYRFRRQTLEGDTVLIVERDYEPVAVPDSIRSAEIEGLFQPGLGYPDGFDPSSVPGVFPPFEQIIEAQDGTLWLRRRVQGGEPAYDVFNDRGAFLGPVPLPPGLLDFSERVITADHIYGIARDELDVQYVVRLRIRR